jgi:PPP family 3-phenylpropionic acid transporter
MAPPARPDRHALRLSLFYAAFFVVTGTMQPFWPVWLASKGLGASEIGFLLALSIGIKVLSTPFAAHRADRLGERQRPMVALALASAISFALFGLTESFWPILGISLVYYALWPSVMSLGESLTFLAAREASFEYGRIRLWGSVTFIVTAIFVGWLLVRTSADAIYVLILGGLCLTTLACAALPDLRAERSGAGRLPVIEALRDRRFVMTLIACGLIQGSHAVYYAFGTLDWQAVGYSEDVIGALWAEGVIAEIILFAAARQVAQRIGANGLIVLAGIASGVRWIGTGLLDELPALVLLQALHGFSFGAAHLGAMHAIGRQMPPRLSATAQSLYSGVVWGLFLGSMLMLAGRLYADFGAKAYLAMAVAGLIGAVIPLVFQMVRGLKTEA